MYLIVVIAEMNIGINDLSVTMLCVKSGFYSINLKQNNLVLPP